MIEPIARIRISLQETSPEIWRRLDVPLSTSLLALHDIIQIAMGWTDSHLFMFHVGDRDYGVPYGKPYDPADIDERRIRRLIEDMAARRRGPLMSHRKGGRTPPQ